MKNVIEFISKQGYLIMLAGMVFLISGVLLWLRIYRGADDSVIFAWVISSIGITSYLVGRIGVALKTRKKK